MPAAMTAHVVYSDIDANAPATTSPTVINDVIRGEIGFDGLLMCDDLSMRALSGDYDHRAQSSFAAGCDVVLHCNGNMQEMRSVFEGVPEFSDKGARRLLKIHEVWQTRSDDDEASLREEFEQYSVSYISGQDPTEQGH